VYCNKTITTKHNRRIKYSSKRHIKTNQKNPTNNSSKQRRKEMEKETKETKKRKKEEFETENVAALIRATVSDVVPLNEDQPDGLHLATITFQVLVRNGTKNKDVDFLLSDEVHQGDLISGFLRVKPQKANPERGSVYWTGLRKAVVEE